MTIELLDATDTLPATQTDVVSTALAEVSTSNQRLSELAETARALHVKFKDVAFDVATTKGMDEAKKARLQLREDARFPMQKLKDAGSKLLGQMQRQFNTRADELIAEVAAYEKPIHEQIQAEENRKAVEKEAKEQAAREAFAALQSKIDAIRAFAVLPAGAKAADMAARIAELTALDVSLDTFGSRAGEAAQAKQQTLERLDMMHDHALEGEATAARLAEEKAELARQRAEQEAREKAERERAAAEQKAAADKLAAERAAFEKQQQAAREEARKQEAADRARRDEEERKLREARAEVEAQQRKLREEEEARAAAARQVEQDRLDAEAAAERQRLDEEAAALRAKQQREADEARAKAQAEAKKAARAAAKLAAAQKAGPRLLAILLRVNQAIDGAANADDLAGAMSILAPEIKQAIAEGEAA